MAAAGGDGPAGHVGHDRPGAPAGRAGIELSPAQVYRLVAQRPERLSLGTLAAICDALECTPNDLIEITEAPVERARPRRRRAAGDPTTPPSSPAVRPVRARIVPDQP